MALIAGSTAYPRIGALTQRWGNYTQTWRSLATPATIGQAFTPAAAGWLVLAVSPQPTLLPSISTGSLTGGRLLGMVAEQTVLAVYPLAAGTMNAAGGSVGQTFGLAAQGAARIRAGGDADTEITLIPDAVIGVVVRPSILPPGRSYAGRLGWRT